MRRLQVHATRAADFGQAAAGTTPFLRCDGFNGEVWTDQSSSDSVAVAGAAAAFPGHLLARVLSRVTVHLDVHLHEPSGLFAAIAERAAAPQGPSAGQIHDRLWQRHRRKSPRIVGGLCVPHAAVPVLQSHRLIYLRLAQPLPDAGGEPIRDALALLIPRPGLWMDHLLLDGLQDLFTNPDNLARLPAARSPATVRACVGAMT